MKTKTCGECKYRYSYHYDEDCNGRCKLAPTYRIPSNKPACSKFEPIPPPTNGDKILQGGNRELAEFLWKLYNGHICSFCVFLMADDDRKQVICKRPPDKTCTDGIEAWLNAPEEAR